MYGPCGGSGISRKSVGGWIFGRCLTLGWGTVAGSCALSGAVPLFQDGVSLVPGTVVVRPLEIFTINRKIRRRSALGGMRAFVSTIKIVCLLLGLCVAGVALVGILCGKALALLATGLQSLSGLEFS